MLRKALIFAVLCLLPGGTLLAVIKLLSEAYVLRKSR